MAETPQPQRKPFPTSRGAAFGTLTEVFPGVWWVWGTTRFLPGATFPRNMLVFQESDGLVLIHPVMLPDAEQAKLDALGPVKHIVRLGDYHGMDDAKYVERYAPTVWSPRGATPVDGVKVDQELAPGEPTPFADGVMFRFERTKVPETILLLAREGGTIVACDAVQNWETWPDGCSFLGKLLARAMGFGGRSCIGPGWLRAEQPRDGVGFGPDFRRLLDADFRNLLPSHGPPVKGTAKADLQATVDRLYPTA